MPSSIPMEQKIIRDLILERGQQMLIAILLLGAILGSSILILRRIKEEKELKIEVIKAQIPNPPLSMPTQTLTHIKTQNRKALEPKRFVININKADKDELIKLPTIGPKLAKAILEYRKQNGPFKTIEDIIKVKGIGEKKFEKCKGMITLD